MPIALYSFKIDSDGRVRTGIFSLAANQTEAEKILKQYAALYPKFGPAFEAGETIDIAVEVDQLPDADEQSIEEFLDLDEPDDDDDSEEEGEEEEPEDD